MDIRKLAQEIIEGKRLTRGDDLSFFESADLDELCRNADEIRKALCGEEIDLCSIINGRSGRCSEDCRFCAQNAHYYHTGAEEYDLLDPDLILADCKKHAGKGVHRYSIVTAGRDLKGKDLEKVCGAYKRMKEECRIRLCASHGMLSEEAFLSLRESGVSMYHANIETSKRNFPEVCSGGIIGMGEAFEDRLDMAVSLAELGVKSIPVNALMPINPDAKIRLAAGRSLMEDSGRRAFHAGANAPITGDLLTTCGNCIDEDKEMLAQMGFHI